MKAMVLGLEQYEIKYAGATAWVFVKDFAQILVECAKASNANPGQRVFDYQGDINTVSDFITVLDSILPGSGNKVKETQNTLPFAYEVDDSTLQTFLGSQYVRTPLANGVKEVVSAFQALHAAGKLPSHDL
jgi:hypothetical protein